MKPYSDLNTYLRSTFGRKIYKLSLSGGVTCPTRDISRNMGCSSSGSAPAGACCDISGRTTPAVQGGCIFCSSGGSGDFAAPSSLSVKEQLHYAKKRITEKEDFTLDCGYIAYFQSYTATYAPRHVRALFGKEDMSEADFLRERFSEALSDSEVVALSIGTRPDCLGPEIVSMLAELSAVKPVWVELGLQTIHESTASFIRRGYGLPVFTEAVRRLKDAGLKVIVHLILGLPDESPEMMLDSVRFLAKADVDGVKLQLLHVLSDTDLGSMYLSDPGFGSRLAISEPEEYIKLLSDCLRLLPPRIVIHRLTGDGPHDRLLYPLWSANKRTTLNGLLHYMNTNGYRQGDRCD